MSGRRIDLSATQVIASMLAAVTGAVAASYLGVAGTIVGTAVMSVASTAVAAIYKHYIGRSRERLRAAREAAARSAPLLAHHRATQPGHDVSQAATRTDLSRGERGAYSATRPARTAGPDAEETQVLPAVASGPHRWDGADRANGLADGATQIVRHSDHDGLGSPANGATQFMPRPDPGAGDDGRSNAGDVGPDAPRDARWRRPRPLVLAGIALGVFLLAMAGITAFEALVGEPLDAVVGNGHGSGTTIGSIVGGSGGQTTPRHAGPAHPSGSPSPTPRAPTTPTPTATPTPTPTSSASPTPSPVPSPAPSESPGASPGSSPGAAQTGSPLAHGAHLSRSPTGG
jgi:hypothetical protein